MTLIQKNPGRAPQAESRIAVVLAGGAVSGGAFEVGGLKALDDFLVGRKIGDMDLYVGLSAGAILAASLAAGITPDELVGVLDGTSSRLDQLRPLDIYSPNLAECVERPLRFGRELFSYLPALTGGLLAGLPGLPASVGTAAQTWLRDPSYRNFEGFAKDLVGHFSPSVDWPHPAHPFPSGLFDNTSLERWLRRSLERIRVPNEFSAFASNRGKRLYLTACNLDTAERCVFGPDENTELTISEAVQASSALPIFYKPARIRGVDYVDGGVRHTANIDVAIEKGADLVICYNPFRPLLNRPRPRSTDSPEESRLADRGLVVVLDQVFRTLLHSRLDLGIHRYLADESFQGDILILEPQEQDARPLADHPLAFWRRESALQHGFESVRETLEGNFEQLESVLGRHGIELDREAASRRAARARVAQGWEESEVHVEAADSRGHVAGA